MLFFPELAILMYLRGLKYMTRQNTTMTKKIIYIIAAVAIIAVTAFLIQRTDNESIEIDKSCATDSLELAIPQDTVKKYGFPVDDYMITYDTIKPRETLAEVLYGFGFTAQQIFDLTQCPDSIFDERKIRPGEACALLCDKDSTARYFVYETSPKSYVTFDIANGFTARKHDKPTAWVTTEVAGRVNSSLWVAMQESNTSPLLTGAR